MGAQRPILRWTAARVQAGLVALLAACAQGPMAASAQAVREIAVPQFPAHFPYRAFEAPGPRGAPVRWYLSGADAADDRPLFVMLQGSGCSSHFFLRDGQLRSGWHSFVRQALADRAQLLLVEKPGVALFDQPERPGTALACSAEFRERMTRSQWLADVRFAMAQVRAARLQLPRFVAVIGHSEGAAFAPHLIEPGSGIKHIVLLAAHPLPQLHDFVLRADAQTLPRVLLQYTQVLSDPHGVSPLVLGHTPRYWREKFQPFDWQPLLQARPRLLLVHGDADAQSSVRGADAFAVEAIVRGLALTWLRVPGAGHNFTTAEDASTRGLQGVLEFAVDWVFDPASRARDQVWPLP